MLAYILGRLTAALVVRIGSSFARRFAYDTASVEATRRPLRTILASGFFASAVYTLQVSLAVSRVLNHLSYTGFVIGLAWLILAGFHTTARAFTPMSRDDGGVARDHARARTRWALLQRIASAAIVGVTVAVLLLQFDVVRHVGLSLLASAGIAGVVIGFAAQKSLAGIIAGIQLSLTQPIRLGDTIFIEGETGVVQDIFLTYAIIRLWDDRCIIVPLARFLDTPFQNWTLLTHDLAGAVLLHVKFTAPVPLPRQRARELCDADPRWDKRSCELYVGDSDMYGMILRVVISARNPRESWELQCLVREGLIDFLRTHEGGIHLG